MPRRYNKKVPLNATQLKVLRQYRSERKEIEVCAPNGELVRATVRVKVYPSLKNMKGIQLMDLIPPPRKFT